MKTVKSWLSDKYLMFIALDTRIPYKVLHSYKMGNEVSDKDLIQLSKYAERNFDK